MLFYFTVNFARDSNTTTQVSSTYGEFSATFAVNGLRNDVFMSEERPNQWFLVNFPQSVYVGSITVKNKLYDGNCSV